MNKLLTIALALVLSISTAVPTLGQSGTDDHSEDWYFIIFPIMALIIFVILYRLKERKNE